MLRITIENGGDRQVLRLEGDLRAAWIDTLHTSWREAMKTLRSRTLWVDLSDVFSVDDAGRRILADMHRAGVRFVTRGCLMPELLREISEAR